MPLSVIAFLMFAGTAVLIFFIIYAFMPTRNPVAKRLDSLVSEKKKELSFLEAPATVWQKFLSYVGKKIPLRPSEQGKYARTLVAAGIRKERLPVFLGAKVFLAAALPAVYLVFYGLPLEEDTNVLVLISVALVIVGFLAPTVWLSGRVKKRQLDIFHDLPDILDLMTVCVEAGLSMDSAMLRISDDRQFAKSPLSKEMRAALQETRAGKPRYEALKDMGERAMEDDLRAFAAMLIQTERLGTSLANSLRVHSDSLRVKRRQRAEEEAAKTTVKLLFPLVFLLMPAMLVVVLAPALIRIMKFMGEV